MTKYANMKKAFRALKQKCQEQTIDDLINGYTLIRMLKQPNIDQTRAMVAVGEEIEARLGEIYLDGLMDEIDALKFTPIMTA